jgi:hypothetical protein
MSTLCSVHLRRADILDPSLNAQSAPRSGGTVIMRSTGTKFPLPHALVISTHTDFLAFCRSGSPLIFFGWRQKANQIALPRH